MHRASTTGSEDKLTYALAAAVRSRTDVRRALGVVDDAEFRRLVNVADRAVAQLGRTDLILYCAWVDDQVERART